MVKAINSPKVNSQVNSAVAQSTSPVATAATGAATGAATSAATPTMDTSLEAWILNIRHVLHFPVTILSVAGLLVAGAFAETAPRKSLEFLDNYIGHTMFFVLPLICSLVLDWPTGLLAAAVSLIVFARLQKPDSEEGFDDSVNRDKETDIIPNPKRWFVESVLGETPLAISSDKIKRGYTSDEDSKTSSSSSMSSSGTSDGNK
jgi:hypothetical protein